MPRQCSPNPVSSMGLSSRHPSLRWRFRARYSPLPRGRLPDRLPEPRRPLRDRRPRLADARDDRPGRDRLRPVRRREAGRVSRSSPTRPRSTRRCEELADKLAVPVPNEHTDRYHRKAKEQGVHIQTGSVPGSRSEVPGPGVQHHLPDRPGRIAVTSIARCIRGCRGRSTPARTTCPDYGEPLFPVAETEIGTIGCAICYDWLFPEAIRELALQGAEVLGPGVGVHGPVGCDAADGLVDGGESLPGAREHGLRGGGQPGGEPRPLPAVLLAGREHGGRLRRPHSGAGRSGAGREDRGRARSTWRPCGRSGNGESGTICSPTCGPRPTATPGDRSIRRAQRVRSQSHMKQMKAQRKRGSDGWLVIERMMENYRTKSREVFSSNREAHTGCVSTRMEPLFHEIEFAD